MTYRQYRDQYSALSDSTLLSIWENLLENIISSPPQEMRQAVRSEMFQRDLLEERESRHASL